MNNNQQIYIGIGAGLATGFLIGAYLYEKGVLIPTSSQVQPPLSNFWGQQSEEPTPSPNEPAASNADQKEEEPPPSSGFTYMPPEEEPTAEEEKEAVMNDLEEDLENAPSTITREEMLENFGFKPMEELPEEKKDRLEGFLIGLPHLTYGRVEIEGQTLYQIKLIKKAIIFLWMHFSDENLLKKDHAIKDTYLARFLEGRFQFKDDEGNYHPLKSVKNEISKIRNLEVNTDQVEQVLKEAFGVEALPINRRSLETRSGASGVVTGPSTEQKAALYLYLLMTKGRDDGSGSSRLADTG